MTVQERLQVIQKASGKSQQELAEMFGVSFVSLNRWMNGKALPRPTATEKIDEAYRRYTGQMTIPETALDGKKRVLIAKQRKHKSILNEITQSPDVFESFQLALTYHTNRIEGSSLSEPDTAAILFQNVTLPSKSLVEHLEAKNHQIALLRVFGHIQEGKPINERFVLQLHGILMNGIRPDAGTYRRHAVRIVGTYVPTTNPLRVPERMKEIAKSFVRPSKDVIKQAADIHARFEQIHPFSDGNGRVGRLLLHAMLLRANLPPSVIRQEKKALYYRYLNKAQMESDLSLLQDYLCDAIMDGYAILEQE